MKDFYGPGGTRYVPEHEGASGRVGVGTLGDGSYRIRVEPSNGAFLNLPGWAGPGTENWRYSTVAQGECARDAAVEMAISALLAVEVEVAPPSEQTVESAAKQVAALSDKFGSLADQLRALRG